MIPDTIHIGCLNCGGGEMLRQGDEIIAKLNTVIYGGFGGWCIKADSEYIYYPNEELPWDEYPVLQDFETLARKEPHRDWRAILTLPLREAEYQRQGENRWVLIRTSEGFA